MQFRPNPLLYGINENFSSAFKIAVTMRSEVDHQALSRAVAKAIVRYPFFSVYPERQGNSLILQFNNRPVPVFNDGRTVVLGTDESNGHLLAFGCEKQTIFMNLSHYISDGMGTFPFLKTVLYLYIAEKYGVDGLNAEKIDLPGDTVMEEEYSYPFFDEPLKIDSLLQLPKATDSVYELDSDEFDNDGLYAYHLRIPQQAMMEKANPSDGSPVSFLSIMLYRALCALDANIDKHVVVHVQHQYRFALKTPLNRHSLVCYIPVALSPKAKDYHVEYQNTIMRGQVIIGSDVSSDLNAVNRLSTVFPNDESVSLEEKKQAMKSYVENSIRGKTFGISYVGKIDFCGLDQYIDDIQIYIGEKNTKNMLLIEVTAIHNDFLLDFMQSGRGNRYVNAFIEQLKSFDIPACIVSQGRYTLCDSKIPD